MDDSHMCGVYANRAYDSPMPGPIDLVAADARAFRTERLSAFDAGQLPARLVDGPRTILHVVPARAFETGALLDLSRLREATRALRPLSGETVDASYNFDGYLVREAEVEDETISYVQVFRNGVLEFLDTSLLTSEAEKTIPTEDLEHGLARGLAGALACLQALGAAPPVLAYVTLLRLEGLLLDAGEGPGGPIDRDEIVAPEIVVSQLDAEPSGALKPVFDILWNSVGQPGSPHFDGSGRWRGIPI